MVKDKRAAQQFQSRLLDAATTLFVLGAIYRQPSYFNPWNLTTPQWIAGGIAIKLALTFYDHLVIFLLNSSGAKLLPTRTTGKPVRYVTLDTISKVYLTINAFNEWLFVQRFCHFLWYSDVVDREWSKLRLINTLGCIYVMFVVMDFIYAPIHHILHMPWCYPLIHKHHHRQHFPTRGYLDAGNEHPIEHMVGVLCTWGAALAAAHTTGAHVLALFFFFNIHAALAMLNHSPFDVSWNILGLKYSVGTHEMHHRKFTVNYAQYTMWYDHIMKTFAAYEGPSSVVEKKVS
jgi:sterol desaturase/sphingolipid hydroxylase (fatty acid hydroxylase superfamily)